ncbi:MAG: hypothetical protein JSR54_02440, partial [Proteobacteria bacterium]|nr:hypothetical protein [Pseudomonadota bacterium]
MGANASVAAANAAGAGPRWVERLYAGLVGYVVLCVAWMLTGVGGEQVRHYVGLLADTPACLVAVLITIAATRALPVGTSRTAWRCLSTALGLYCAGVTIGVYSWLHGRDPFPGIA